MKKLIFKGSGVALVTPYAECGVDYRALEDLLEFHLNHKTDALIICGTTGEASTMSEEEHKSVLKFCAEKVKGRLPMIAGTGNNNTEKSIRLSQYAEEIGYDGLLLVTPYYNKTTQKGLKEHYGAIAKSVKLPIILYNVPSRTGVSISLDTLIYLDENYDNIVAVKEASGDVAFAARVLAETGLAVYAGNDDVTLPILAVGGCGVISVVANIIPEEMHNLCADYENGDIGRAKADFLKMLRLMDAMFYEVNPIPVKTAMKLLGFNAGKLRLPLCTMEDTNLARLKKTLTEYGFKIK
ncbi:MAG: 4-hydroxy-tetrahydrodipicolinate synthase [Ruminococcaceae bacterium]|nr:4-hydroxy-tetrahydrodipicolinate synthase [Oscillospiraceae bacterium]